MEIIMAFAGICPYIKDIQGCNKTVCECAEFTFPDKISRREVLYRYCGHPTGWKDCTFKAVLDGYYDRKYAGEDEEERNRQSAACNNRKRKKTDLRTVRKEIKRHV